MNKIDLLLPKTKTYWCDGTGRDSYIFLNNGGFSHQLSKPSLQIRASQSIQEIKSEIIPKMVHYHSNGTGRDQHIVYNEGGFCKMFSPEKQRFQANLRKYQKMPSWTTCSKPDYFQECQIRMPPQESNRQKQLFVSQQSFTERMSIPKIDYKQLFQSDVQLKKMYEGLSWQNSMFNQNMKNRRSYLIKHQEVSPLQIAQKELMRKHRNHSVPIINH